MARSTTWLISAGELSAKGKLGATLVRLMLATNDITIANDAWQFWHGEHGEQRKARQTGAKMYFLRLLTAHLHESMKIIKDIKKAPELFQAVEQCDERTRNEFNAIWSFVGTKDYKSVALMRNKIGSHWDEDVVLPSIKEVGERKPDHSMALSLGDDIMNCHFEPADQTIDRVFVRRIFEIPSDADVAVEADKIVRRLLDVIENFCIFACNFIRFHTTKH
jgi:hypothetical protein